ncbi:hypothetical protein DSO57_1028493 [Entomophthora muscae]|uniref:Uncharacterized protein n=1 Tax=Entomophthora muscae TaxID=34485 RepID=A0ACC2S3L8_9FUNG|nr:hypothetical protein DSO57_1028493 [Entomophthora muscae]
MVCQIISVAILSLVTAAPYGRYDPYAYSPSMYATPNYNYQRSDIGHYHPTTYNHNRPVNVVNNNNNVNTNNIPEAYPQQETYKLFDESVANLGGFKGVHEREHEHEHESETPHVV